MRFAPISTGLLGLVVSCTAPQTLAHHEPTPIVEKPAVVSKEVVISREDRLDSIYAGFIKAYNSAKNSHDIELSYLRNNSGALTVFREGRVHDNYLSSLDRMQGYIAEINALGAETHPFDILLDTIR